MPDIETFKGQFNNLARLNRFKVSGFNLDDKLQYFAKGTSLPSTNVPAMDVNYQGRIIKLDGDRTYEDLELTVYGDEGMAIRQQFEQWMQKYNDPVANVGTLQKEQGQIDLMNRDGSIAQTFTIYGAVCTAVGQIALDWGTNDSPLEFTVTIAYDYHLVE